MSPELFERLDEIRGVAIEIENLTARRDRLALEADKLAGFHHRRRLAKVMGISPGKLYDMLKSAGHFMRDAR